MGKGKDLTKEEKFAIKILKSIGISHKTIADSLHRNKSTITKYLKRGDNVGKQNSGRKSIINATSLRRIARFVDKKPASSTYIMKYLDIRCSTQTLRRAMRNNNIWWKKSKSIIPLSNINKEKRLEFCRMSLCDNVQWSNIIFSDEKRFCMDGMQNIMYGWSKKNKRHVIMKRHSGGGSIMVWAAISMTQKSELIVVDGKLNSKGYVEVLNNGLLPIMSPNTIFQQDNAPIHVSLLTKSWFLEHNIEVLKWPARSPDLNIIENVWSEMSRYVYENGTQYNSISELKSAIFESWHKIDLNYIGALYKSIHRRLLNVIDRKGDNIPY